jgi:uncharacterized glyoxalase superfamily protein PhnB
MLYNRSMPNSTVIPVLGYPDVRQAVEWLVSVFGFTERLRIADHRAQLAFGSGEIVVAHSSATPACHSTMVRVADVDAHHRRVKEAGVSVSDLESFAYGERQYTATDLGGHVWTFSQSIADVDPSSWGGVFNGPAA